MDNIDNDDAIKVGRRNSNPDQERLQSIHDYAVENGATCTPKHKFIEFPDDTEKILTTEPMAYDGQAVKALGEGKVGGYLVRFSTPTDPDVEGDFFTRETDFGPHTSLPLYYHHGQDATLKMRSIGQAAITKDDVGLWCEAQLAMRDRYERAIYKMAEDGKLGYSSGVLFHLMEREPAGRATHVKTWVIGEASLTPTPAEPRNVVTPIKSLTMPPAPWDDGGPTLMEATKMDITEERLLEIMTEAAGAGAEKALKSLPAEPVKAGVQVVKDEADQGFATTGEYFKAVKNAGLGSEDVRLKPFKAQALGINETVPSEGGYLVPPQVASGIIERMYPIGSLLNMVASDPVTGNTMTYNAVDETSRADGSRYGGITSYWGSEAGTPTASQPKWKQLELKLKKIYALAYATDEVLEDAPALESWLMRTVPNEIRFRVEDAFVNGTGVGTPLGFLKGPAVVSVTKETNQVADTIVYENVIKMWARRWIGASDYVWFINQDVLPQLLTLAHAVGTAALPANFVSYGMDGSVRIMGRPVIELEYMPTLGDAGDITLFSPSQYQTIRKNGIQAASSIHVQFLTGQVAYRFTYRVDGMPMWDSVVTPFKGTANTIAPTVIIAERA